MVDTNCVKSVLNASDRTLIDEEYLEDVYDEAIRLKNLHKIDGDKTMSDVMKEWVAKRKVDAEKRRLLRQRNEAFNTVAQAAAISDIQKTFGTGIEAADGIIALYDGDGFYSDVSADTIGKGAYNKWVNSLAFELDRLDPAIQKMIKNGKSDPDLADAMFRLKNGQDTEGIHDGIVTAAKAINDAMENVRKELNLAGASINKLDDWIWRSVHDHIKIRKAELKPWREFLDKRIDYEKTFGYTRKQAAESPEIQGMIDKLYEGWFNSLSTGNHLRASLEKTTGTKGRKTSAGSLGRRRSIRFKDGRGFHEYQTEFGQGRILDAINGQLRASARSMGLMKRLGPDYEDNINAIIAHFSDPAIGDADLRTRLADSGFKSKLDKARRTVDGSADIPDNDTFAAAMGGLRKILAMAKMGMSQISALSDVPNAMANASMKGRGFFSGLREQMSVFANHKDYVRISQSADIGMDVIRGGFADDFMAANGFNGKLARVQEHYYKWNLLAPWTRAMRAGVSVAESNWLYQLRNTAFDQLDEKMQRVLGKSGIGKDEWAAITKAVVSDKVGETEVNLITAKRIDGLDDDVISDDIIADYVRSQGGEPTSFTIQRARAELADKLRVYLQKQVDTTIVEPNARTRRTMLQGTTAGSPVGEMMRAIMQFKSFPFAILTERVLRDIEVRTGKKWNKSMTMGDALGHNGWAYNMGTYLVAATFTGGVSIMLKDMAKGLEARDPMEDPKKFMLAAFLQGGGSGIYGDLLFGEAKNRYGGNALTTLLGPTAGFLAQAADVAGRAKATIGGEEDQDVSSSALRLAFNNIPGVNLLYFKAVLDYFIIDRTLNTIDPGQAQRRANRYLREMNQKYRLLQTEGF